MPVSFTVNDREPSHPHPLGTRMNGAIVRELIIDDDCGGGRGYGRGTGSASISSGCSSSGDGDTTGQQHRVCQTIKIRIFPRRRTSENSFTEQQPKLKTSAVTTATKSKTTTKSTGGSRSSQRYMNFRSTHHHFQQYDQSMPPATIAYPAAAAACVSVAAKRTRFNCWSAATTSEIDDDDDCFHGNGDVTFLSAKPGRSRCCYYSYSAKDDSVFDDDGYQEDVEAAKRKAAAAVDVTSTTVFSSRVHRTVAELGATNWATYTPDADGCYRRAAADKEVDPWSSTPVDARRRQRHQHQRQLFPDPESSSSTKKNAVCIRVPLEDCSNASEGGVPWTSCMTSGPQDHSSSRKLGDVPFVQARQLSRLPSWLSSASDAVTMIMRRRTHHHQQRPVLATSSSSTSSSTCPGQEFCIQQTVTKQQQQPRSRGTAVAAASVHHRVPLADVEADYPEIYYADDYEATTRRVARTATETGSTRTRRREAGMEDLATGDGADDLLLDDDENGAADVASRYDDENGFYIHASHDYIANRYEVFKALGRGSFGEVVRAFDHKHHRWVALKIVRSEDRFRRQAAEEVRMLQMLRDADGHGGGCHIVRMLDHFDFRRHPCIVFECLGIDLYEALRRRNFRGFPFGAARRAAVDIARCLCVLRRLGIIHCDLKPENVLLTVPERRGSGGPPTGANINVKVVDFGSSCFENDKLFVYVQSRFYRAPEVILGAGYGTPVDMWSLGCIVAELVTGRPLFAGEDETDQLTTHVELLGMPPASLLSRSKRAAQFFSSTTGLPRYCTVSTTASTPHDGAFSGETMPPRLMGSSNRSGTYRGPPGSKDLVAALMKISGREPGQALNHRHREYVDFVRRCLCWEPSLRMTPEEALCHSWIVQDSMLSGRPKVLTGACEGRVHHGRPGSHGDENIFS